VTYAAAEMDEEMFRRRWAALGYREHVALTTRRYPARHIAFTSEPQHATSSSMIGLSVSADHASPINELVRRYGEGTQHVAYRVEEDADLDALQRGMSTDGWVFMTPILTYRDHAGARLRQLFAAPTRPFGCFIGFVQRLRGPDGQPFDGFDPVSIDDLYAEYAAYSRSLERRSTSRTITAPSGGGRFAVLALGRA
jgi:hypothetical protein